MNTSSRALLAAILGALGTTVAAACGTSNPGEDASFGDASAPDAPSPGTNDAAFGLDAPSDDASVLPPAPPLDGPACPVGPTSTDGIATADRCGGSADAAATGASLYPTTLRICFPLPAAPATCATYSDSCIRSHYTCGLARTGHLVACGPLPQRADACCFDVVGDCPVGRPFTVGARARVPSVVAGAAWSQEIRPHLDGLDDETRAALAEAWATEGATEHASVASFARMALELLALGAPAGLVEGTVAAAADETHHAVAAFGLAAAYGGAAVGPGPLDVGGCLDDSTPRAVALRLVSEGCIAETVSAAIVAEASARATCPVVRAHLARVADDEARHAVLAWRTLAWMLGSDRALAAPVAAVLADAHRHVGLGTIARAGDAARLADHGQLAPNARRAIAHHVLRAVVAPAAKALLQGHAPLRPHATS